MIILPVALLAFWLVLQAAIVLHAQHLAQAAAQDAAVAGAAGGDAASSAYEMMDGGSAWVSGVGVAVDRSEGAVTVRVTADVIQLFPLGSYSVAASGSAPVEAFIAQPERP